VMEVVRVSKNPDTGVICMRKKLIRYEDIESIEDANSDILGELGMSIATEITLPYEIIVVIEDYTALKTVWLKYIKEKSKLNMFNKN
jgi:hypothetical protein